MNNLLYELELQILDQVSTSTRHAVVNDKVWLSIDRIVSNGGDRIRDALVPRVSRFIPTAGFN